MKPSAQPSPASKPPSRRRRFAASVLALLALALLAAAPGAASAEAVPRQVPPPPGPGPSAPPPIRVFIETPTGDPAALVAGLPYVRLAAGPEGAQVDIRITVRPVQGKDAYDVALTGQGEFAGLKDDLPYIPEQGRKPEDIQKDLSQVVQLGLMRYVARTPLKPGVKISLLDRVSPTAVVDPWNFWVFGLSATTFLSGETSYLSQMYFGTLSAVRVTPEWKVRLAFSGTYEKDHYDYVDYVYDSSLNSLKASGLVVKSLDDHWSIGSFASAYASSFSNIGSAFGLSPAVEYDVFPYSESTRRQLRILYRLGAERDVYLDETIYDKRSETLFQQTLSATLELKRPWGDISTTLEGATYLHDFSKYHLELNSEVSIRIFKGLSLNLDGGAEWIHDQLSLAKGGASLEDILLQRKLLSTSYDVFFMFGLSYSFGSVHSNVVNPRFGQPGSGGYSMRISM
jgi:hypothetical protein